MKRHTKLEQRHVVESNGRKNPKVTIKDDKKVFIKI
jgi:hypothetical protein